jgi:hypothetical protein
VADLAETRHMGGVNTLGDRFPAWLRLELDAFCGQHPGSRPLVSALVTAMVATFFSFGVPSQSFFSSVMTPSRNLWLASMGGIPGGWSFFLRKTVDLEERSGVMSSLLCVGYALAPQFSRASAVLPECS